MLMVDRVSKSYGDHAVLATVSLTVNDGEKVALIGPNGCGKSTLARLIAGQEQPDGGVVAGDFVRRAVPYLPQGSLEVTGPDAASVMPAVAELWSTGHLLSAGAVASPEETVARLDTFEAGGGWAAFATLQEALRGLGIDHLTPNEPLGHLSGGERTKLGLAALLQSDARFLLLDEPSNHLDLDAVAWLEAFLKHYRGAVLLISHDRALVDAIADAVYELDPETRTARRYAGGYSSFLEQRARERESQEDAYRRQQDLIHTVQEDIRRVKQRAARFDATSHNDYHRRVGKKVARLAKVRERRLEKLLTSQERVERPKRTWDLKADIAEADRGGDLVVALREVSLAFGERALLDQVSLVVRHGERLVITGPNGGGKTTLLRLLVGELSPDAGTVRLGAGVTAGYLSQQQEAIDMRRTPLEEVRAVAPLDETAARTYLHRYLFAADDVFVRNGCLSYGQRARLSLAVLLLRGVNLLLLDEPLNHLDLGSREHFEAALDAFGGTLVAVSHDRFFMRRFAERLLVLEGGHLREMTAENPDR